MDNMSLTLVHGIPILEDCAKNWDQVELFQARPDDVLIATYPKAGTTWTSEILDMIYCEGDSEKCLRNDMYFRVPYLEFCVPGLPSGIQLLEAAPSPRLVKTHLPIHMMPESFWEKKTKVIYVARNAKDVAVSYFFFHKLVKSLPDAGPWDTFLNNYMNGHVFYGSWHDHVKGWWEKRHEYNVLYLFYEDMKENPQREIQKILHYLDRHLSDDIVEKIAQHTSFEKMKNNDTVNFKNLPSDLINHSSSSFMRKGVAGDWKNHFTVAQNEKFDEDYERKMSTTDLHFRTEI
ncbi:sulfotransferase 1B1-like isoform X2 [Hyperolius riggenbachi]